MRKAAAYGLGVALRREPGAATGLDQRNASTWKSGGGGEIFLTDAGHGPGRGDHTSGYPICILHGQFPDCTRADTQSYHQYPA